jgi:hypothetical protein
VFPRSSDLGVVDQTIDQYQNLFQQLLIEVGSAANANLELIKILRHFDKEEQVMPLMLDESVINKEELFA